MVARWEWIAWLLSFRSWALGHFSSSFASSARWALAVLEGGRALGLDGREALLQVSRCVGVRLPVSLAQQRPLQLCTRPWSAHIHVAHAPNHAHHLQGGDLHKGVDSRREHVRTSSSWRRVRTRRRTAEGELRAMVRARLRAWGNTWLFSTASSTTPNLAASSPVNVSPVCQSGLLPRNQRFILLR